MKSGYMYIGADKEYLCNASFESINLMPDLTILINTESLEVFKLLPLKNERSVFVNEMVYSSKLNRTKNREDDAIRPFLCFSLLLDRVT